MKTRDPYADADCNDTPESVSDMMDARQACLDQANATIIDIHIAEANTELRLLEDTRCQLRFAAGANVDSHARLDEAEAAKCKEICSKASTALQMLVQELAKVHNTSNATMMTRFAESFRLQVKRANGDFTA